MYYLCISVDNNKDQIVTRIFPAVGIGNLAQVVVRLGIGSNYRPGVLS